MKDEALLKEIRTNWTLATESEASVRREAEIDLRFKAGGEGQWESGVVQERRDPLNPRPVLTVNQLRKYTKQVVNQFRSSRRAIKVTPKRGQASQDTADVIQGLIRHIEDISFADIARVTAFDSMVSCGFGYEKITTEYESDESFDLEIKIERILDRLSVYFDPNAKNWNRSDAKWACEVSWMTKEEFEAEYPKAEAVGMDWAELGRLAPKWFVGDKVMVAAYWKVQTEEHELYIAIDKDGQKKPVCDDDFDENGQFVADEDGKPKHRTVCERTVTRYMTNGYEILCKPEPWPGKWIPIIPYIAQEEIVDGDRQYVSLIRDARGPQQLHNYARTSTAEMLAIAPKSPYVGALGQFKTKEKDWQQANRKLFAYLEYDPVSIAGQPVPPPQRQSYSPDIQAMTVVAVQSNEDIKSTIAMPDPTWGQAKADQSGRAIASLQNQADVTNSDFSDSGVRAMWWEAQLLLDLIPKIYDTERQARIIDEEDAKKIVWVNRPYMDKDGKQKYHDLDLGEYDIAIEVGQSFKSKKQEAAADMTAFAQAAPNLLTMYADLYVKAQDWPMADQIAKRLVPPQFQSQDGEEPLPPLAQARFNKLVADHQALDAYAQQLQGQNAQLNQVLSSKILELTTKKDIATGHDLTALLKQHHELSSAERLAMLEHEMNAIKESVANNGGKTAQNAGGQDGAAS